MMGDTRTVSIHEEMTDLSGGRSRNMRSKISVWGSQTREEKDLPSHALVAQLLPDNSLEQDTCLSLHAHMHLSAPFS